MDRIELGVTFALTDPVTGIRLVGWAKTLDGAIADAVRQMNEAAALRVHVAAIVREYAESSK